MPSDLWAEAYEPLEMLDRIRNPSPHWPTQWHERYSELLNTYTVRCLVGIGADNEADVFRGYAFGYSGDDDYLHSEYERLVQWAGRRSGGSYSLGRSPRRIPQYTQRARAVVTAVNSLGGYDGSPWWAAVAVTQETRHLIQREQCGWLRCLFPDPDGFVTVDPNWLTSTVLHVADGITKNGAFDQLPILADSLQDAGCDNEPLLHHCRHDTFHGPNCWAIGAVAGRLGC